MDIFDRKLDKLKVFKYAKASARSCMVMFAPGSCLIEQLKIASSSKAQVKNSKKIAEKVDT